jgi:hypothetical protein
MCIATSFAQAQDIQYVSAENGLVVREKPNRGANRVALLDYGTAIEITEHTNLQLDVLDNGRKIEGEWVKIKGDGLYEFFEEGYVFNGYLTEDRLAKRFKIPFEEFTIFIDNINVLNNELPRSNKDLDELNFTLEFGDTPEEKTIKIQHHQDFRTIEVFQKHQNSITIMGEGPHCDLLDYKHYESSWKPLKTITNNKSFETLKYSQKDWNKFIEVDISDVITYVKDNCGESWSDMMVNTKSIYDYPAGISISKIFLRVVMTDVDGYKTEKIIIFDIPMGC